MILHWFKKVSLTAVFTGRWAEFPHFFTLLCPSVARLQASSAASNWVRQMRSARDGRGGFLPKGHEDCLRPSPEDHSPVTDSPFHMSL